MATESISTHILSADGIEYLRPTQPVRQLIDMVLLLALKDRASELFFEPRDDEGRLAYRVDGKWYDMVPAPAEIAAEFSRAFKELVQLDTGNCRAGQVGRLRMVVEDGEAALVISIQPTPQGESVHVAISRNSTVSAVVTRVLNAYARRRDQDDLDD